MPYEIRTDAHVDFSSGFVSALPNQRLEPTEISAVEVDRENAEFKTLTTIKL